MKQTVSSERVFNRARYSDLQPTTWPQPTNLTQHRVGYSQPYVRTEPEKQVISHGTDGKTILYNQDTCYNVPIKRGSDQSLFSDNTGPCTAAGYKRGGAHLRDRWWIFHHKSTKSRYGRDTIGYSNHILTGVQLINSVWNDKPGPLTPGRDWIRSLAPKHQNKNLPCCTAVPCKTGLWCFDTTRVFIT